MVASGRLARGTSSRCLWPLCLLAAPAAAVRVAPSAADPYIEAASRLREASVRLVKAWKGAASPFVGPSPFVRLSKVNVEGLKEIREQMKLWLPCTNILEHRALSGNALFDLQEFAIHHRTIIQNKKRHDNWIKHGAGSVGKFHHEFQALVQAIEDFHAAYLDAFKVVGKGPHAHTSDTRITSVVKSWEAVPSQICDGDLSGPTSRVFKLALNALDEAKSAFEVNDAGVQKALKTCEEARQEYDEVAREAPTDTWWATLDWWWFEFQAFTEQWRDEDFGPMPKELEDLDGPAVATGLGLADVGRAAAWKATEKARHAMLSVRGAYILTAAERQTWAEWTACVRGLCEAAIEMASSAGTWALFRDGISMVVGKFSKRLESCHAARAGMDDFVSEMDAAGATPGEAVARSLAHFDQAWQYAQALGEHLERSGM